MPRRPRIHAPGCFYHVTLRGNHRQAIFRVPADRALLNAIIARSLPTSGARIHAYCWMTNHLHLLVQCGEAPLGRLMRDVASNYARAYQMKLDTTGHLFERRYYAKLVHVETYLFAVLRYIHLNPVADGLARSPAEYPWSSHHAYAGTAAPVPWLETDFVLARFARRRRDAHEAYGRFVATPPTVAELAAIESTGGDVLGSDEFTARLRPAPPAPPADRPTLSQLAARICAQLGVPAELLASSSRDDRVVRARAWIAREAVGRGVATLSEIARFLDRDRATLRYAIRRYAATPNCTPRVP